MLIEIILFLLLGILAGTFTGLTPGIHINLVGVFLVSASASFLSSLNPVYFAVLITAMAITHTFIDFIPSVFLGCPDTDTELSVLPGHELLKKGLGYEAVVLTAYGSLAAIFILLLITFPSVLVIPKIYNLIQKFILYFLILISLSLILLERKKFTALFVFLLTGFLGWTSLNIGVNQPLLPLLTGLFGSSMLIMSIKNKIQIPEQKISKIEIKKSNFFRPLIGASMASLLCGFLPGLGGGQAAIIGNTLAKTGKKGFLVLLGATNTLVMGFSFLSLYLLSKTRTGAAVAIKEILGEMTMSSMILILITILVSGIIAFFLTFALAKFFSKKIAKINYTKLSIATLIILTIIVFFVSGILGLAVLLTSTLTGIYCISLKVRRTQMMGCLLIPTMIYYLI